MLIRPNQPDFVNNLILNVPFGYDGRSYDRRIDHNFSDSTKGFAKFNYSDYKVVNPAILGDEIDLWRSRGDRFQPQGLKFRAGYNRYYTNVNGINIDRPFNQELGIRIPNPDPISTRGLARVYNGPGDYGRLSGGLKETTILPHHRHACRNGE